MNSISPAAGAGRILAGVILALVLTGAFLGVRAAPASADTQYSGSIEGKTYRSNYDRVHGTWVSVWGSTRVVSGESWHYIREELHPQYFFGGWNDRPTQVVTAYQNKVVTTFTAASYLFTSRGWSWHKDWYTGDACNTSDGY